VPLAGLHVDEDLDADDGTCSIAAAEIVAAALSRRRDRVPEELGTWLDAHQDSLDGDDQVLARRAVERVLATGSELRALWEEGGTEGAWHADVRALLGRLGGDASLRESTSTKPEPIAPIRASFEREKQTIVTFLEARGLQPTAQEMAQIHPSHDAQEIRRWLARVVSVRSVAEMLDD
jgi:hypothetical protein